MIRVFAAFRSHLRPYRWVLALGALLEIVTTGLAVAQPWPLKVVVDDVLKAPGYQASVGLPLLGQFEGSPRVLLAGAVITLLLIVGLSALTDYWSTTLMAGTGERLGNDIRASLFAHLQALPLRYHGEHQVGDLTSRVSGDVDRVQDMMVQTLAILLPNVLLIGGMVTVMFVVDPVFAALCLAAFPLLALTVYRSTLRLKQANRAARRLGGEVAAATTETLGAIQVVQAFSLEEESQSRFQDLNRASLAATLEAVRHQARLSPAVDVAAAVSTATVFWFGANRVLSGTLSLGLLLVFMAYVASLYKPVRNLAKLGYVTSRGIVSAERVQGILSESPEVRDGPHALPAPAFRGAIRFEDVSFSYGKEPVLRGIDLSIEPGETVALVGHTGAGKSTMVSLIPRFYDPQRGAVRIDGRDVRDYTLASLRRQIALVLQDTVLFRGTLWDNVACGRPGATWDEVDRAIELALVDEFASRLPNGVNTMLGERGVNLSGGQRQRIAIARAIVRGAPILILDEPTSALDAGAESLVVDALRNLMRDRTTVVIAHRLSTIRRADRVVVLRDGEIVEEGSHATLVEAGGEYARVAALQSGLGPGGGGAGDPSPNGFVPRGTKNPNLAHRVPEGRARELIPPAPVEEPHEENGPRATPAVGSAIGRVTLTIVGTGLLIAGVMLDWVNGIAGTSMSWEAFYRPETDGGYRFITSAGAIVILVAIIALLGLATATGWPTRLAGALGVVAFVLLSIQAIGGDVVNSVDELQVGMWLILGGGIVAVIGGFLGGWGRPGPILHVPPAVGSAIGRVTLTIVGAGLLIAGVLLDWVNRIAGTSMSWEAFYRSETGGGYRFITSAGAIVILVAIIALLGLATSTGWPTRLAGALGVVAFVLLLIQAIGGDVVNSVDELQVGMWLILGGGIVAMIGGFLGGWRHVWQGGWAMPQRGLSEKPERQDEGIKEGLLRRSESEKGAEEIAARTDSKVSATRQESFGLPKVIE